MGSVESAQSEKQRPYFPAVSYRLLLIYLLVVHGLLLAGAVYALRGQPALLIGSEVVLAVSLFVGLDLWRRQRATLRLLSDGTAALRDQDYSMRLAKVGVADVDELIDVYNQLLDRVRAERRDNQRQEFFLGLLVESTALGVITMDFDGRIASVNSWAREQLGLAARDELPGTLAALEHPLAKALEGLGERERRLVRLGSNRRFRCESAHFIDRGFRRRFIVVSDLSGELAAAEVAAFGKVIRMMAHEVNNSTAATRSLLQSLLDTADLDDAAFRALALEYLPLVAERGEEQNEFMRRFADVVRLPDPLRAPVDLAELLRAQLDTFAPLLAAGEIAVHTDLQSTTVEADASLLARVIVNALTNARESIVAGGRAGTVVVSCRAGGFVIADDGPGISVAADEALFTPFFSTKPTGQGIGLAVTREVLERHGATYALATEADGWTRLRVSFVG